MSQGPTDLAGSHLDSVNLLQVDTVPVSAHSQDLLQCIIEHEENGMPLVITGVDCDSYWHSQSSPVLRGNTPVDCQTGTVRDCS